MTCSISLGPEDNFELTSPSGRRVYIPNSPHALQLLWQVLWNSTAERAKAAHFVNGFPTQKIVDLWAEELGAKFKEKQEERKAQALTDRFGFDLKELDIDI